MKKTNIILSTISIMILMACAPDQYVLNHRDEMRLNGIIMSRLESVEKVADNALRLHPSAVTAMRYTGLTQFMADYSVKILKGSGMKFAFRTVSDTYPRDPSLVLAYTTDGYTVYENGRIVAKSDTVSAILNEPARIKIRNQGKMVKITIGCDLVYYAKTELPATEYVILETLEGTEAYIYGIEFADILESDDQEIWGYEDQTRRK